MAFFEPPPPAPKPQRYRTPEWHRPPENFSPGVVALELVLANTGAVAVWVSDALVYRTGIALTVVTAAREDSAAERPVHRPGRPPRWARDFSEDAEDDLYFGVQFPDGAKATNLEGPPSARKERPDGPVLHQLGGHGNGERWDQQYWIWPLPPPGELLFACEWKARQIALTKASVDASLFLAAAERVTELWPAPTLPERPPDGGPSILYVD